MPRTAILTLLAIVATSASSFAEDGFKRLDDGKSFDGWKKAAENEDSWTVEDGAFKAHGSRAHLFYTGDDKPFVNFELKVDVMTKKNSNGGIYFHTQYQKEGWPKYGFEVQVNNTYEKDPRKTGSLYAVKDVNRAPAKDDVWFTEHVIVKGDTVTIKVDGKTVVEYTEPEGTKAGKDFTRKLDKGTFALQAHDPGSIVYFKNIRVKRID
jgi:hypothetical protein